MQLSDRRVKIQTVLSSYQTGFTGRLIQQSFALGVLTSSLVALPTLAAPSNPELKIGIKQRFGQEAKDQVLLQAAPGDRLTVKFPNQGKVATFTTDKLQVGIEMLPLTQPREDERLVISRHRSFESAETSANYWRGKGVPVELAQPDNWQVWAQRDRYDSTVNRLLLLQDLKSKGLTTAYMDRKLVSARPILSWTANGYHYRRNELDITSGTGVIQVGTQRYGGRLRFQPNTYGTYTLVNKVPVETYLRGVVPYEIGHNAPASSVQAQTILARTYALRNLRRFKIDNYELCADTQCQVYEGLNGTNAVSDSAIASTQGKVLTYNSELIDALYSSTTGGVTAPFEDVWEGNPRPYLQAKIDAYPNQIWDLKTRSLADEKTFRAFIQLKKGFNEVGQGYFRWKTDVSLNKLNQNLRDFLKKQQNPLATFGTIQNLEVISRSAAGRVQKFRVTTDKGSIELTKDQVLLAFEAPSSLLFYVEPLFETSKSPDKKTDPKAETKTETNPAPKSEGKALKGFAFIGGGLGHGVGLSQTGSYALSQMGWSAEKILSFYYPSTSLQALSAKTAYWKDDTPPLIGKTAEDDDGFRLWGWKFPELGFGPLLQWFHSLTA
jgi:SpoIID/LytB domain protein